mgnify:CR=1 FL=1
MTIQIDYEAADKLEFDYEDIITKVINEAMDYEECPYESEVNVVITDNEGIHQVNKEFRDMDKPTDVLSFPMVEYEQPGNFDTLEDYDEYFHPESGELLLGDIMISVDKVREQAAAYGHSLERELGFLVAHSMLHLFGYDHIDEEERVVMERKQEEILQGLKLSR